MTKTSVIIEMLSDCQTSEVVNLLSCIDLSASNQRGLKAKIWSPDRVFRKKTAATHYKSIEDLSNQLLTESVNSVDWKLDKESEQMQILGTTISEIVFNLKVSPTCSLWSPIAEAKMQEWSKEQVGLTHKSYEQAITLRGIKRFPTSLISTFELDFIVDKEEMFWTIKNLLPKMLKTKQLHVLSCARIFLIFGGRFLNHELANILFNANAECNVVRDLIIQFAPLLILNYSLCEKILSRISQLNPILYADKCLYCVPSTKIDLGILNLYPFIKKYGIIDVKYALRDLTFKMPEIVDYKKKTN